MCVKAVAAVGPGVDTSEMSHSDEDKRVPGHALKGPRWVEVLRREVGRSFLAQPVEGVSRFVGPELATAAWSQASRGRVR